MLGSQLGDTSQGGPIKIIGGPILDLEGSNLGNGSPTMDLEDSNLGEGESDSDTHKIKNTKSIHDNRNEPNY